MAEEKSLRRAKPIKPTTAMAKPISIPVAKRASRTTRPAIPIAISFILAPPYLHYIKEKDAALNDAAGRNSVRNGIKWDLKYGRYFPHPVELVTDRDKVVRDKHKEDQAYQPSHRVHDGACPGGNLFEDEFHGDMPSVYGNLREAKADHHAQERTDNFIGAQNSMTSGSADNIGNRQKHHEREGGSGNNRKPFADPH